MKVLVTGATGYIGSNVSKKLKEQGYEVYILVKENSDANDEYKKIVYRENLVNLIEEFNKIKFDLVVHCAAFFVAENKAEDVDNLIKSNVLLTTHILEAMKETGVKKIINTSTSWQHYHNEDYNPVCLYAATKQAAEDIIKFYCETEDISSITLTIFDSYGPNDKRKKLIGLLGNIYDNNKELKMSPGEQYVDYIYIDDIVDAYVKSVKYLEDDQFKGFNKFYLNSDNPLKLRDVIKTYEKVFEKKLNVVFGAKPYRKREVMTTYQMRKKIARMEPQIFIRGRINKNKK